MEVKPKPRPEPTKPEARPDIIDVSPKAEAGDQDLIKKDDSFPDVKPKQRPEGRSELITRGYEIDGREVQVDIIKFKSGEEIALDKVIQNIDAKGTANEPVITKNTVTQVLKFLEERNPTREEFETYWYNKRLNKGGALMEEQMQMAFMSEGGLKDDGMDKDPVSGNEVPSGSMAEEVRDNIPAQLSEGEYVVPADVVRYYGVKFFEDLRDRAKMGLAEMEADGRIGGEPVPAGGPINEEELSPQEMQAIREMMGMAEGGDIQNPYMQQQLLYSQPRPAPIDDQKDTIVDITNPVINQMPIQNMAMGGEVKGYAPGGLEQSFLNTGQQAVNRGFVGFPLGATIFPSEKTGQTALGPSGTQVATTGAIDTAIAGTAGTDTSALTTVTLYSPDYLTDNQTITLTLPTQDDLYKQKIAEGWTTEMPVAGAPVVKGGGDDDDDDDKPKTDPNAWMDKFNYNDFGELGTQTSDMLKKAPVVGAIGAFVNGTRAAQAAANIIIMKANGQDTTELEKEWNNFVNSDPILRNLPDEVINGDRFAKEIMLENIRLAQSKARDLDNKPLFEDDQAFRDHMSQVLPETVSSPGLSGSTAASQAEVVKEQEVMSQEVVKKKKKKKDKPAPVGTTFKAGESSMEKEIDKEAKAFAESGKKFDMNDPSTWGSSKGGLMTKGKKKK
jgi:hypothetical protein